MENKTINFFYQLAQIPRESGNEDGIVHYLCNFAQNRNLEYYCDNFKNVVIKKKNSDKKPLILQAHTDMVCEKENSLSFNFSKESIAIYEENGFLKAHGTTLGADNGIGVAQILAILDSDIPCNIEAVFTSTEETTMDGAMNFDASILTGKTMINLDGFEENTIIIESAAFFDILLHSSYCFTSIPITTCFDIFLTGLEGGHSGFEIDKNKGNACILLATFLKKIDDLQLVKFTGGTKFNVIPSSASSSFITTNKSKEINSMITQFVEEWKKVYPSISITLQESSANKIYAEKESRNFLEAVCQFSHGVFSAHDGTVTTSLNLGVIDLETNIFKVGMRSSREIETKNCIMMLVNYSRNHHLSLEILSSQPGFESTPNSRLLEILDKTSPREYYQKKPIHKSVHITVETGFFKEKIKDLDVAIISPNIQNAHTPQECVEIASIIETDNWLARFIEQF